MFGLIHHPAVQSLLLPALAVLLCTVVLQALGGPQRSWALLGPPLGLVLAMVVWPGMAWPVASQAQKLPWVALVGLLAMVLTTLLQRGPWFGATLVWAGSAVWLLGYVPELRLLAACAVGALVLGLVALGTRAPRAAVVTALLLAAALFGLALVCALGGSLLLAQLAAMAGVATSVAGLWAWVRRAQGSALSAATLLPLATAALFLACLAALSMTAPTPSGADGEAPYYTPRW